MKALKNLSLILLLVLTFTGCHDKSSKLADFNRAVYTPEYASGFDIKGADGKKSVLVTVTNPWQGADSITTYLFIARDGESVPEDFTGQVLGKDAERIICMSSTHIAMLDAIGETGRVVGVSGIDYISNPDIQARRDSVGDVGYEGNINYELLLSLDPDLVLLYGVNGASSMEGKLKELDIPFMYVGDYLEESAGQSRMAVGTFGDHRKTGGGRKSIRGNPRQIQCPEKESSGQCSRCPVGDAQHPLRRQLVHALDRKLCRPNGQRCRRRLHLQKEHGQCLGAHRPGGSLPAGLASRYVAACGYGEHARRAASRLPEVHRHPLFPWWTGL